MSWLCVYAVHVSADHRSSRQQGGSSGGGLREWFAHAFAVDKPEDIDPTPTQREVVDRLCSEVVRRGLTTPASVALEMSRPLNGLSAAAMHMFQPIISAIMTTNAYDQFALFLEHRGSIDYLLRRIEHFEREAQAARQAGGSQQDRP